jgi:MerR family mercuric resistance operon transcriptional regulator
MSTSIAVKFYFAAASLRPLPRSQGDNKSGVAPGSKMDELKMATRSAERSMSFPIGELARFARCSIDTIRYYERIGVMPKTERTGGGHRLYRGHHVQRLAFIRRSRMLGLNLDQVRQLVGGIDRNSYSCAEIRALFVQCATGIRNQINELQEIEKNLRTMVDVCGDAELMNCKVVESMLAGDNGTLKSGCCSQPSDGNQS